MFISQETDDFVLKACRASATPKSALQAPVA